MKGQRTIMMVALLLCGVTLMAQNTMRVHYKDGNVLDISIAQMDSVTFVDKNTGHPEETVSLTASWLWGNVNQGYYEVITFSDDHTYTGYDNYFSYGFDSMTYGWWTQIGAMLTLQSNGFGYLRRYNWYITELTANALGVMTNMGPFTYYKVQPETLTLRVGESLTCQEGDSFLFADGVKVAIQDGNLVGLSAGETYIQKLTAPTNTILSYKIIVE